MVCVRHHWSHVEAFAVFLLDVTSRGTRQTVSNKAMQSCGILDLVMMNVIMIHFYS